MKSIRALFLLLTCVLYCTSFADEPEPQGVTLDVEYQLVRVADDPSPYHYKFYLLITNRTTQQLTVPSSAYEGRACCWLTSMFERGVTYNVGQRWIGDHRVVDSPARYLPVQLEPGESTQFATFEVSTEVELKVFSATIRVSEEYAKRQGWWGGRIDAKCDLSVQKPTNI
jgi:hypothetical protein